MATMKLLILSIAELCAAQQSPLTDLAAMSPVLRAAEDLVPYGSLVVCLLAVAAGAVIITNSWSKTAAAAAPVAVPAHGENKLPPKRRRAPECRLAVVPDGSKDRSDRVWRRELPPNRYAALRTGETDPPNLPADEGGIEDVQEDGVFECAGCGTPLYDNDMRFEAGSGWPCFFTCLDDSVREREDANDGVRMELVCNACNSHIGHIFRNEQWDLPPPAERHCVNSLSLRFVPDMAQSDGEELQVD